MARLLIEGAVAEPGAWMPEQIVDPGPFLSRLANRGLRVEFPEVQLWLRRQAVAVDAAAHKGARNVQKRMMLKLTHPDRHGNGSGRDIPVRS